MSFKKIKNLKDLIKDAQQYQYADIADTEEQIKEKKPKAYFTTTQWIILVFAVLVNFVLREGYHTDFCGYVISGLSLFVGIFFTFIIALYDKFNNVDFSKYHYSNNIENYPLGIRLKNYYKKTTVLSIYLILLSIVCILLLSCTLLFESTLNQHFELISVFTNIGHETLPNTLKAIGIVAYRSLCFYFLIDFVLITVYLLSSIYDYIISEYNKVKLK